MPVASRIISDQRWMGKAWLSVMTMTSRAMKANRTEWAAVFLTAAELVRQRYLVSFTMGGRTPVADLIVGRLDQQPFWVDVKGIDGYSSSGWFATEKDAAEGLFYILVSVGETRDADRFFIMSQDQANTAMREWLAAHPNARGAGGITWSRAEPFENKWDSLDRARTVTV